MYFGFQSNGPVGAALTDSIVIESFILSVNWVQKSDMAIEHGHSVILSYIVSRTVLCFA